MTIKKSGLVLAILFQFVAVNGANRLFLENHYGAPIICKVLNNNIRNTDRLVSNKDTVINNQSSVLLGTIPHAKNVQNRNEWVTEIAIKTARYLSAGYTQLGDYLDALSNAVNSCCNGMSVAAQNRQYCNANNICNKDAVIIIYPSSAVSGWNIDIQWRDPQRTIISGR